MSYVASIMCPLRVYLLEGSFHAKRPICMLMVLHENREHNQVMGTPGGVVHCLLPLMNILNEEYGIHEALVTEIKSMGEHMLTVDGPTK